MSPSTFPNRHGLRHRLAPTSSLVKWLIQEQGFPMTQTAMANAAWSGNLELLQAPLASACSPSTPLHSLFHSSKLNSHGLRHRLAPSMGR